LIELGCSTRQEHADHVLVLGAVAIQDGTNFVLGANGAGNGVADIGKFGQFGRRIIGECPLLLVEISRQPGQFLELAGDDLGFDGLVPLDGLANANGSLGVHEPVGKLLDQLLIGHPFSGARHKNRFPGCEQYPAPGRGNIRAPSVWFTSLKLPRDKVDG
jgi:hypothetical protein